MAVPHIVRSLHLVDVFDKTTLYTTLIILICLTLVIGCEMRSGRRLRSHRMGGVHVSTDPRLEAKFRSAILDERARGSLLQDALRKTNGNRTAAMRRVLEELHGDNERWS